MSDLQEGTRTLEEQLGKIAESQTLLLSIFVEKPEPNPVEDLKMMRVEDNEDPEELDYINAHSSDYIVEDLMKRITLKNRTVERGSDALYQHFISQVAIKVR
jgi:hypothetical protein